ncbi:MAG: hypothetical protein Hyperionvirus10_40 [Hyperionvirus sp.]|uniref:Ankyrin repeat protein n=1 Tax=Hyperionvirus sp. TaxID=2487770 RepID=A0A3G5AAT6_9VIRU|nr:MAG: hypothetical protein Hyperionvirus10_40 [Hyperionvirus sp.]
MNKQDILNLINELTTSMSVNNNLRSEEIIDIIIAQPSKEIFSEIPFCTMALNCYEAAWKGNLRLITFLFKSKLHKNKQVNYMMMAMAAEDCHLEVVQFLLNIEKYMEDDNFLYGLQSPLPKESMISIILSAAFGQPCFKTNKKSIMSPEEKSIRLEITQEILKYHMETVMAHKYILITLITSCEVLGFVEIIRYLIDELKIDPAECLYGLGYERLYQRACFHSQKNVAQYYFEKMLSSHGNSEETNLRAIIRLFDTMTLGSKTLNFIVMTYDIGSEMLTDKVSFQIAVIKYFWGSNGTFEYSAAIIDFLLGEAKRLKIIDTMGLDKYIRAASYFSYVKQFEISIVYNTQLLNNDLKFIDTYLSPVKNFWRCMVLDFRMGRMDLLENFDFDRFIEVRNHFKINLIETVFENGNKINKPTKTNTCLYNLVFEYSADYINDIFD